ncbi:MAG: efflux RND transporter periplasmic adaptor subunit [Flavobacteriales bacterium]|nr:efflux RND transporter periplasmic adaptor subunit [Flavobacteriales bacterium]
MSKRNKWLLIVGALVIIVLLAAVGMKKNRGNATVETEMPQVRTIIETVSASGKIQPEIEVKISAEVSGQIISMPVKEGEIVEKGQLLVQINPDIYESALNRANAALNTALSNLASAKARKAQAQAQFMVATKNFERNETLLEQGAISQADFDQALSSFEVAKADLEAAEESVKSASFQIKSAEASKTEASDNLGRTNLIAPQAGTVTAMTKEEGERVLGTGMTQGETIMKVSNLSTMEVNVEVNESDIVKVHLGDTALVEVDAYLDQKFKGIVTEIGNTALNAIDGMSMNMDQVTNFSVKIRILPSSYAHLTQGRDESYSPFRPGMSATVDIQSESSKSLSIPVRAVATRTDTSTVSLREKLAQDNSESTEAEEPVLCVFVVENGKAQLRVVETGIQDSKFIEIKSGLKEDDEVVIGPYDQVSRKLRNGVLVEVSNGKTAE